MTVCSFRCRCCAVLWDHSGPLHLQQSLTRLSRQDQTGEMQYNLYNVLDPIVLNSFSSSSCCCAVAFKDLVCKELHLWNISKGRMIYSFSASWALAQAWLYFLPNLQKVLRNPRAAIIYSQKQWADGADVADCSVSYKLKALCLLLKLGSHKAARSYQLNVNNQLLQSSVSVHDNAGCLWIWVYHSYVFLMS